MSHVILSRKNGSHLDVGPWKQLYFIYKAESYKIANFWFLLTHKNGIFIWPK